MLFVIRGNGFDIVCSFPKITAFKNGLHSCLFSRVSEIHMLCNIFDYVCHFSNQMVIDERVIGSQQIDVMNLYISIGIIVMIIIPISIIIAIIMIIMLIITVIFNIITIFVMIITIMIILEIIRTIICMVRKVLVGRERKIKI